jgi:hypothetical protein
MPAKPAGRPVTSPTSHPNGGSAIIRHKDEKSAAENEKLQQQKMSVLDWPDIRSSP